jgi:hypothetical protein
MVVFLMLKVVMAKGRRLKKGGGDLEVQKQNVVSSKKTIKEQNVVALELKIDESSNLCGLKLTMMIVCNSNGEITFNIN